MLITHDYTRLCVVSMANHKQEWLEVVQESGRNKKKDEDEQRCEYININSLMVSACVLPKSSCACE